MTVSLSTISSTTIACAVEFISRKDGATVGNTLPARNTAELDAVRERSIQITNGGHVKFYQLRLVNANGENVKVVQWKIGKGWRTKVDNTNAAVPNASFAAVPTVAMCPATVTTSFGTKPCDAEIMDGSTLCIDHAYEAYVELLPGGPNHTDGSNPVASYNNEDGYQPVAATEVDADDLPEHLYEGEYRLDF